MAVIFAASRSIGRSPAALLSENPDGTPWVDSVRKAGADPAILCITLRLLSKEAEEVAAQEAVRAEAE